MAKLKKPFKGTAGMKKKGKGNIGVVISKAGVKKPHGHGNGKVQEKHGSAELMVKLKAKLSHKNPLIQNKDVKEMITASAKHVKKDKKLPVKQPENNKSGQKDKQKSKKIDKELKKKKTDFLKEKSTDIKLLQKGVQEDVAGKNPKKKFKAKQTIPEPSKNGKMAELSKNPEGQLPPKKSKKNKISEKAIGKLSKIPKSLKKDKTKLQKGDKKAKAKKSEQIEVPESNIPLEELVPPFDENKFLNALKRENVTELIKGLKRLVQEEVSKNKNQIFSDYRYILNVTCFMVPLCPKRFVKLKLKHSLVSEDDDVCLIVKDLKRGSKFDFEPTIHFYEDLLKEKGVKGVKTIIPINQLKKEYGSYEMKRKLSNLYDYFLCDGAIVGHAVGFLGTHFQKPKCTLHSVRFTTPNVAHEIRKALYRTSYRQGEKGTTVSIAVGTDKMSPKQVADNILTVISQLKTIYPGGLPNIRHLHAKINIKGTSSVPLYFSDTCPPEKTPIVIGPREQKLRKMRTEVNQILTKFQMTPTGEFVDIRAEETQKKRKRDEGEGDKERKIKKKKASKEEKLKNEENNATEKSGEKLMDIEKNKQTQKKKAKKAKIEEINDEPIDEDKKDDEVQDEIQDEVKPEPAPQPEQEDSDSTESTFTDSTIFDTSFSSGSESSTEYSGSPDTDDTVGYSDDENNSEPSVKENGVKESDEDNESENSDNDDDDDDDEGDDDEEDE